MIVNNKLDRAVSIEEMLKMKFKTMNFTGEFYNLIGTPECAGSWIIWGQSGNGKTRFSLQLSKYLSKFSKVVYNTLEEGKKMSFQKAIRESNMMCANGKIMIVSESIEELSFRLSKRRSPKIAIIDSLQYSGLDKSKFKRILEKHPNVLFIFISHAEGKNPKGTTADAIRYHSDVKIRVEGYRAFAISRYGGGEPYTICPERSEVYWGSNN